MVLFPGPAPWSCFVILPLRLAAWSCSMFLLLCPPLWLCCMVLLWGLICVPVQWSFPVTLLHGLITSQFFLSLSPSSFTLPAAAWNPGWSILEHHWVPLGIPFPYWEWSNLFVLLKQLHVHPLHWPWRLYLMLPWGHSKHNDSQCSEIKKMSLLHSWAVTNLMHSYFLTQLCFLYLSCLGAAAITLHRLRTPEIWRTNDRPGWYTLGSWFS